MIDFLKPFVSYLQTKFPDFKVLRSGDIQDIDYKKIIFVSDIEEIENTGDTTFANIFSVVLKQTEEEGFLSNVDFLLGSIHKKYVGDTMFFVERVVIKVENNVRIGVFRVKAFLAFR